MTRETLGAALITAGALALWLYLRRPPEPTLPVPLDAEPAPGDPGTPLLAYKDPAYRDELRRTRPALQTLVLDYARAVAAAGGPTPVVTNVLDFIPDVSRTSTHVEGRACDIRSIGVPANIRQLALDYGREHSTPGFQAVVLHVGTAEHFHFQVPRFA